MCRPAGWDNQKKISILYENMHACKSDDFYSDIIAQPPSRKTVSNREAEVVTEDEQAFLIRQQQLLQQSQQGGQQARSVSPMRTPQSGGKSAIRTPGGGQGSPNKTVRKKLLVSMKESLIKNKIIVLQIDTRLTQGAPAGEGVLANFFNSLLHKKSGSPGTPSGPNSLSSVGPNSLTSPRTNGTDGMMTPDKTSMRTDAAAELDRLAKSVKKDLDFATPPTSEC